MKYLREFVAAAEKELVADWKKSGALFVVWSLLFSLIGNLGFGPFAMSVPHASAAATNLTGVSIVDAGFGYGVALKSDGSVWAWGANVSGQLGNGTLNPSLYPEAVTGLNAGSGVIEISAGYNHVLALKSDGTVLAWGNNSFGQLGDGTTTGKDTPTQVTGLGAGSGVVSVSAGFTHSVARKSDGTVLCWGRNSLGACGTGDTANPKTTPVTVTGAATGVAEVYAGANFTIARKDDGSVIAWGTNTNGSLGDGTTAQKNAPVNVLGLESGAGVTSIATPGITGSTSAFAVKGDGTVLGWGLNTSGQLGNGLTTNATSPQEVSGLGAGSGITKVAAGTTHTYALKSDGTVYAWGANGSGQVGDGSTTQRLTPVLVSGLGSGSGVTALSAGDAHGYARKSDGTVLAWGNNSSGQLGNGSFFGSTTAVQTSGLGSGSGVSSVSAGNLHSLALKSDGTVLAWGDNTFGQLGDGTTTQRSTPVQVSGFGSGSGVIAVSAGQTHSLAVKSDGTVWAWGSNSNGQLGDTTTTQRETPVLVADSADFTKVTAGSSVSYGIKSDGSVFSWGTNTSGTLGIDSTTTTQSTYPVPVTGLGVGSGAAEIVFMQGTALLRKTNGQVMGWGLNSTGAQLIDGTTVNKYSPIQISTLDNTSGVTDVAGSHIAAQVLKSDGTVLAWGANAAGQVGDGTLTTRTSLVQVSGLGSGSGVSSISAGSINGFSTYALKSNGIVLAWGDNSSGQLGDGTTSQRTTPVQVVSSASGSGITQIDAGSTFVLALKSNGTVIAWGSNTNGQLGDGTTYTTNLTPANVLFVEGGSAVNVAPSIVVSQPNGGEVMRAGESKLILWGGTSSSQVVNARVSLSTDGGATFPTVIATTLSASGYWLWTVPSGINTESARIKVDYLQVDGSVAVSDMSDADFFIIDPETPPPSEITGGEGSGTSTPIVEGADTSASGQAALTRDEANLQLPPAYPVDSLVKVEGDSAVYYLGLDAKRHPFVNAAAYYSWYTDFDDVEEIGLATLVSIPLGEPILARPGTHWVKISSDPKTYYVEPGYRLRWIKDEATAVTLGGTEWNRYIIDVDPSFLTLYTQGPDIDAESLKTGWPSGMTIADTADLNGTGLRYYVSAGTKRAFVPSSAFDENGFQSRFSWNDASVADALKTLEDLPAGPDIVGPEDGLFSLMH